MEKGMKNKKRKQMEEEDLINTMNSEIGKEEEIEEESRAAAVGAGSSISNGSQIKGTNNAKNSAISSATTNNTTNTNSTTKAPSSASSSTTRPTKTRDILSEYLSGANKKSKRKKK